MNPDEDFLRALGMALRAARKRAGIKQETLAEAADIGRSHLSSIERGCKNAKILTWRHLAQGTSISMLTLFEEAQRYMQQQTREFERTVEVTEEGILVYTRMGPVDVSNIMVAVQEMYHVAKEQGVHKILANYAGAVFQKQADARYIVHRVVERLAVVWIGSGIEQELGQLHIATDASGAVERRQRIFVVRTGHGRRRPAIANPLVGVCAGREQKPRAAMKALAKFRNPQQG